MTNPEYTMLSFLAQVLASVSPTICGCRQWLAVVGLCFIAMGPATTAAVGQDQSVNRTLLKFQQRFADPTLVRLNSRVHAAYGFDFANFGFIEGINGVVVVDTGWFPGSVQPAWDAFRKICSKPVKAIIYTHVHGDHTGGAIVFAKDADGDWDIYAPHGWKQRLDYSATSQYHMIFRRAFAQMGLLLPSGTAGTVGSGIGPAPRPSGIPQFLPPTITVEEECELEIAGIRVGLIPTPGDIESHMMVWLPEDKILFSGDILGGTLPFIATPRFEPDRDPYGFIKSLEIALALQPTQVVPGHGRLLIGEPDVEDVLQANIDVIRFLADQVQRLVTKGYSADRIIDTLKLPPALADHPDLQPHYHRLDWIIRGLVLKQAGFVGDVLDLCRLTDAEQAKRLVVLLGGAEATLNHARKAVADGDPRWGATLATYVAMIDRDNSQAAQIRADALRQIAATTDSAAERNYLLTAVQEESGTIDWNAVLAGPALRACENRPSSELLSAMSVRFDAEQSKGAASIVRVNIEGETASHYLIMRNYSLLYRDSLLQPPDAEITLSRDTLNRLWAKKCTWVDALQSGTIHVQSGPAAVRDFVALIE